MFSFLNTMPGGIDTREDDMRRMDHYLAFFKYTYTYINMYMCLSFVFWV